MYVRLCPEKWMRKWERQTTSSNLIHHCHKKHWKLLLRNILSTYIPRLLSTFICLLGRIFVQTWFLYFGCGDEWELLVAMDIFISLMFIEHELTDFWYNWFTWLTNWFSFHRLLKTQETNLKYQLSPISEKNFDLLKKFLIQDWSSAAFVGIITSTYPLVNFNKA